MLAAHLKIKEHFFLFLCGIQKKNTEEAIIEHDPGKGKQREDRGERKEVERQQGRIFGMGDFSDF